MGQTCLCFAVCDLLTTQQNPLKRVLHSRPVAQMWPAKSFNVVRESVQGAWLCQASYPSSHQSVCIAFAEPICTGTFSARTKCIPNILYSIRRKTCNTLSLPHSMGACMYTYCTRVQAETQHCCRTLIQPWLKYDKSIFLFSGIAWSTEALILVFNLFMTPQLFNGAFHSNCFHTNVH